MASSRHIQTQERTMPRYFIAFAIDPPGPLSTKFIAEAVAEGLRAAQCDLPKPTAVMVWPKGGKKHEISIVSVKRAPSNG
jgi:hypothetical protein